MTRYYSFWLKNGTPVYDPSKMRYLSYETYPGNDSNNYKHSSGYIIFTKEIRLAEAACLMGFDLLDGGRGKHYRLHGIRGTKMIHMQLQQWLTDREMIKGVDWFEWGTIKKASVPSSPPTSSKEKCEEEEDETVYSEDEKESVPVMKPSAIDDTHIRRIVGVEVLTPLAIPYYIFESITPSSTVSVPKDSSLCTPMMKGMIQQFVQSPRPGAVYCGLYNHIWMGTSVQTPQSSSTYLRCVRCFEYARAVAMPSSHKPSSSADDDMVIPETPPSSPKPTERK